MDRSGLKWFIGLSLAAFIGGCGEPPEIEGGDDEKPFVGNRTKLMPKHEPHIDAIKNAAAPQGAHLTYYGGPIIQNVKVVTIFWNANVAYQSQLNGFYTGVTNSAHFDWLSEYNTNGYAIGRGTRAASYVDNMSSNSITDAQIQAEITRLANAGLVPAPDANTLYMVHFQPGATITDSGGSKSCQVFCAYHGTYARNTNVGSGTYIYYGVIPDMGGNCASGCGTSSQFNNTTSVASHELIEAVTDPAVGVATTYASPLAWYDQANGEIGDICNAQQGTVLGGDGVTYTVQAEFSNQANNCIVTRNVTNDFSVAVSPASATVAAGATVRYTITTAITSGVAQTVNLAVSGLPTGVTGSFSPASITGAGTSTLTLTAAANAASASATFTVTATGTSATHTATGSVTVTGGGGGGGGSALLNGGFETALTPWVESGSGAYYIASGNYPHGGTGYAYLGNTNSVSGTLYQQFTIPNTAVGTLSFWLNVQSNETTGTTAYDKMTVTLRNGSGTVLATLATYSNLNKANAGVYAQKSFNVAAYKGQTVRLQFDASTDSTLPTVFRVDDATLQ